MEVTPLPLKERHPMNAERLSRRGSQRRYTKRKRPTRRQTVERDERQAMPRAEPALSLALLPLSAMVGAAIRTAITTPVKGVLGTTTLWLPLGKPRG